MWTSRSRTITENLTLEVKIIDKKKKKIDLVELNLKESQPNSSSRVVKKIAQIRILRSYLVSKRKWLKIILNKKKKKKIVNKQLNKKEKIIRRD